MNSHDEQEDPDYKDAWDAELERRKLEILSGSAKGRSADEVFADLEKRFQ
jgi:hypothetical protein